MNHCTILRLCLVSCSFLVANVSCSTLCADCAVLASQWREGMTCAELLLVSVQAFLVK